MCISRGRLKMDHSVICVTRPEGMSDMPLGVCVGGKPKSNIPTPVAVVNECLILLNTVGGNAAVGPRGFMVMMQGKLSASRCSVVPLGAGDHMRALSIAKPSMGLPATDMMSTVDLVSGATLLDYMSELISVLWYLKSTFDLYRHFIVQLDTCWMVSTATSSCWYSSIHHVLSLLCLRRVGLCRAMHDSTVAWSCCCCCCC